MVVCNLDDLLWQKRMRLSDLSRKTGIDYTTLLRLKHNRSTAIHFKTLEAVCHALGCSPGDLLKIERVR